MTGIPYGIGFVSAIYYQSKQYNTIQYNSITLTPPSLYAIPRHHSTASTSLYGTLKNNIIYSTLLTNRPFQTLGNLQEHVVTNFVLSLAAGKTKPAASAWLTITTWLTMALLALLLLRFSTRTPSGPGLGRMISMTSPGFVPPSDWPWPWKCVHKE